MLILASMLLAAAPMCWPQDPPPPQSATQQTAASEQTPPAAAQQQSAPPDVKPSIDVVPSPLADQRQPVAPGENQSLTIPAGTRITLSLVNQFKPKAARRGDAIRAVTAFPVTVGSQVAIPAGIYLEGVVDKLVKKNRYGHPWVEVHFTRMVSPSGYVLRLEGASTDARVRVPFGSGELGSFSRQAGDVSFGEAIDSFSDHEQGPSAASAFQFPPPQQPPTLPPLPKPNYGPAIALGVGGAAAAVAIAVIAYHHRYDEFWYEPGWQFDMVLQSPLTLDPATWNSDPGQ